MVCSCWFSWFFSSCFFSFLVFVFRFPAPSSAIWFHRGSVMVILKPVRQKCLPNEAMRGSRSALEITVCCAVLHLMLFSSAFCSLFVFGREGQDLRTWEHLNLYLARIALPCPRRSFNALTHNRAKKCCHQNYSRTSKFWDSLNAFSFRAAWSAFFRFSYFQFLSRFLFENFHLFVSFSQYFV